MPILAQDTLGVAISGWTKARPVGSRAMRVACIARPNDALGTRQNVERSAGYLVTEDDRLAHAILRIHALKARAWEWL